MSTSLTPPEFDPLQGGAQGADPALVAPHGHIAPNGTAGASARDVAFPQAERIYNYRGVVDEEDDGALFGDLFEVFWQRKWTILLCLAVGLLAGVIYLARATPIYRGTAMIFLDQSAPMVMPNAFGGFTDKSMESQSQVITSTSILARALELPAMKQAQSLWEQDNPLGFLRLELEVEPSETGEILLLSLDSPHAQDNAIIVNTIVQAYSEYHHERRRNTAAEVLKVLQREKFQLNDEVKRLTDEMLAFQRRHGSAALRTTEGGYVFGQELQRLAATLTEAELRTLNAKLAYDTAVEAGDDFESLKIFAATDPSFEGFDLDGQATPEAAMLAGLQRERRTLTEVNNLGDDHKTVAAIDTQIAELRGVMDQGGLAASGGPEAIARFYRGLLKQRWLNAQLAESKFREKFNAQQAEAVSQNSLYHEYGLLEASAERADRQLELIDSRIRELNLNEDYDVIDVTVLEPAEAAEDPVRPLPAKVLAMALALSLALGCGLAYLQEMLDDRLRSGDEISALLRLPVLGVVPAMPEKDPVACAQMIDRLPQSVVAEAFRTVRTAIHFSPAGAGAQVIMVTSPSPGEGKSTIAANLAIAVAQAGKRTLLLDADLRKPRQHRNFVTDTKRGLTALLTEKRDKGDRLESPIVKTNIEHLDVLPCGAIPGSPAELLNGQRFGKLIRQLRTHYDQIIIDTPPTVPVSDSRIISASVDGFILILRAGKSGRKMARHTVDLLASVGARPIGIVINGVTNAWGSYAYYSRYGYYQHGYGEYRDDDGTSKTSRRAKREAASQRTEVLPALSAAGEPEGDDAT